LKEILMTLYKNLIVILACLLPTLVLGGGGHHHNHESTTVTNNTVVTKQVDTSGVALSIAAAQHQFDWGTYKLQGAVGFGGYDNSNAISLGVGKRLGKDRMLLNGSVGIENNKLGYGAGMNWRF